MVSFWWIAVTFRSDTVVAVARVKARRKEQRIARRDMGSEGT
jgi:hypothetical protein